MKRFIPYILLILAMFSCKKKQESIAISGSFALEGTSYSLTSLRIDHVGYAATWPTPGDTSAIEPYDSARFILCAHFSGYQGNVVLYLVAPDNDFLVGTTYDCLYGDSLSCITLTTNGDTTQRSVLSATLNVDSIDDHEASGKNWLSYHFSLMVEGSSSPVQVSGQFVGPRTVNYTVDQPSYGVISFDTITAGLARPSLYRWNHLFCDDSNYFELKFYSNEARFSDNGNISHGVQFVIGIHSFQQNFPAAGDYPVSMEAEEATAFFGHKDGSVNWGTYWQVFYNNSVIGKANILSDTLHIHSCTTDSISLSFSFNDQLGNIVAGNYSGRYY